MREGWEAAGRRTRRAQARRPMSRLLTRIVVVAVSFAVAGTGGVLLDRTLGRSTARGAPSPGFSSGAWFCPHGGSHKWRGWVVVANPGRHPVSIRLSTFGEGGQVAEQSFSVPAATQIYREVPVEEISSATEVEYFGGWVGASFVLSAGPKNDRIASSECDGSSRRDWFVLDQPTGRSENGYAIVMNPFYGPAEFDVIIRTPRRTVRPSVLTPYVLGARRSVAIEVNKFALEAPGEKTVTVQINQRIGRVVAGSLGVVPGGIRAEVGLPSEKRWLIPAAASEPSTLLLVNPGSLRARVGVTGEEETSEQPLFDRKRLRMEPGEVEGKDLGDVEKAGLVVSTSSGRQVAAAVVVDSKDKDSAAVGGIHRPDNEWLVLPGTPPDGGEQVLILQNPARTEAVVQVTYLGAAGPVFPEGGNGSIRVPGGRTVEVEVKTDQGKPLTAVVKASVGTLVAAEASYSGKDGYASSVGMPMRNGG